MQISVKTLRRLSLRTKYIINIELVFIISVQPIFKIGNEWGFRAFFGRDFDDDIEKFAFENLPNPFLGI